MEPGQPRLEGAGAFDKQKTMERKTRKNHPTIQNLTLTYVREQAGKTSLFR